MKHPPPLLPLALPLLGPGSAGATATTGSLGGGLPRFWNGLIGRRWTIAAITLIAVTLALPITDLRSPRYRGSVLIQIERNPNQASASETSAANADDRRVPDQTQLDLLRSRTLARQVIDQLGLHLAEPQPTFIKGLARYLNGLFGERAAGGEPEDLEAVFLANLRVTPVKDSSLVRIQFDSPRPDEAAAVTNAVAANLISATRERADQAGASARATLGEQGRQIRAELDAAERRLAADAARQGIIDLNGQIEILMNRLKDLSREQAATEAARIAAQAQHQQVVRDGPGRTAAALDSPVIQTFKEQQAELSAQYQEQLKVFKPGYPKMVQLKAQIAELEHQIEREATRIGHAARSDYQAKARQETKLATRIDEIKTEIRALKERGTAYQASQREVDFHRAAYAGLLQRMKEIGAGADRGAGTMAIVDAAAPPHVQHAPNLAENLAIAIAIGLFGGAMLAALLESLDDTLRSSDEAEHQVGAPVFGIIPWMTAPSGVVLGLVPWHDPRGVLAESFRSLCTALTLARPEGTPRVIHFCSAAAGEGKTTAACAAAITFAQGGSKVLLIDGDLRNPSLHQTFGLPNTHGLTNCLTGAADPHQIAQTTAVAGLFVICGGPVPPNPVELLASARMTDLVQDAARRFDHVILDGPPMVGLADALILAHLAGATLMVIASRATRAGALAGSLQRLRVANARILGAVLVKHRRQIGGYGADDHLVRPRAEHNPVLSLPRAAAAESITANNHALEEIFHPDRTAVQRLRGDTADTTRINQAYQGLHDQRAHDVRALTDGGRTVPHRHPEPWFRPWAAGRPGSIRAHAWLFGGTVGLVAAALVIVLGTEPETLRMADSATAPRLEAKGAQRTKDTQDIPAPAVPPDPSHAWSVAAADPTPAPPTRNRAQESAIPDGVEAKPAKTAAPLSLPVEPAKTPGALIARFQHHFVAGDLAALLLLLTDNARIANLADPQAQDAGTDFFEAAVKRTLRLTALRTEPHGERQFVATGTLLERRRTVGGPAGEVRLELTGEATGYRISALLYRIDPKFQDRGTK